MIGLSSKPVSSLAMVHPSQQKPPHAQRRRPACITVTRDGKARTYRIRPWAAGMTLGGFVLCLTAYIGATAYLVYRDDLLGAALSRQVEMQYSYEDRIAALRSEIDRVMSRNAASAQGIEQQLATLLQRQELIRDRQSALDQLVDGARTVGLQIAAVTPAPPQPAAPPESERARPGEPEPLAYAPARAEAGDPITGTLIRDPAADRTSALPENLQPLLFDVQSWLGAAEDRQSAALDALAVQARSEADKLSAALAPIGLEAGGRGQDAPQGGPFIPASSMHFVERAAMLRRTLDEIGDLRRFAEAMPLGMPVRATRVSSRFGYRDDPFVHRPALHSGLDFVAASGTEVQATAAGIVVSAGWNGGYGQMVEIRHAGGLSTRYAHMSAVLVEPGARVSAGTPVGRVGSTGRSTGPHLHYETRRAGKPVNPAPYLAAGRAL